MVKSSKRSEASGGSSWRTRFRNGKKNSQNNDSFLSSFDLANLGTSITAICEEDIEKWMTQVGLLDPTDDGSLATWEYSTCEADDVATLKSNTTIGTHSNGSVKSATSSVSRSTQSIDKRLYKVPITSSSNSFHTPSKSSLKSSNSSEFPSVEELEKMILDFWHGLMTGTEEKKRSKGGKVVTFADVQDDTAGSRSVSFADETEAKKSVMPSFRRWKKIRPRKQEKEKISSNAPSTEKQKGNRWKMVLFRRRMKKKVGNCSQRQKPPRDGEVVESDSKTAREATIDTSDDTNGNDEPSYFFSFISEETMDMFSNIFMSFSNEEPDISDVKEITNEGDVTDSSEQVRLKKTESPIDQARVSLKDESSDCTRLQKASLLISEQACPNVNETGENMADGTPLMYYFPPTQEPLVEVHQPSKFLEAPASRVVSSLSEQSKKGQSDPLQHPESFDLTVRNDMRSNLAQPMSEKIEDPDVKTDVLDENVVTTPTAAPSKDANVSHRKKSLQSQSSGVVRASFRKALALTGRMVSKRQSRRNDPPVAVTVSCVEDPLSNNPRNGEEGVDLEDDRVVATSPGIEEEVVKEDAHIPQQNEDEMFMEEIHPWNPSKPAAECVHEDEPLYAKCRILEKDKKEENVEENKAKSKKQKSGRSPVRKNSLNTFPIKAIEFPSNFDIAADDRFGDEIEDPCIVYVKVPQKTVDEIEEHGEVEMPLTEFLEVKTRKVDDESVNAVVEEISAEWDFSTFVVEATTDNDSIIRETKQWEQELKQPQGKWSLKTKALKLTKQTEISQPTSEKTFEKKWKIGLVNSLQKKRSRVSNIGSCQNTIAARDDTNQEVSSEQSINRENELRIPVDTSQ